MVNEIHLFSVLLKDLTEIIVNLHLLALLFVNLTKSPGPSPEGDRPLVDSRRLYRLIELFAGLVTPAAKQ
jgi:hypothetical protein